MAEKAAAQITAIHQAVKGMFEGPFGSEGACPKSRVEQAMLLSSRTDNVSRELTDEDLIKFLSNPCDIHMATLGLCHNATQFPLGVVLAAQAKLVDTNAPATAAVFLRSCITLIKTSNQMNALNSELNV
jgi:hypothetical protein